jgi:hypothetical protein
MAWVALSRIRRLHTAALTGANIGQGVFLALHLWANAVLALVYHPELLKSPSGMETPLNLNMDRSMKLSLASSRQICECMVFADLVDSSAYVSVPC